MLPELLLELLKDMTGLFFKDRRAPAEPTAVQMHTDNLCAWTKDALKDSTGSLLEAVLKP